MATTDVTKLTDRQLRSRLRAERKQRDKFMAIERGTAEDLAGLKAHGKRWDALTAEARVRQTRRANAFAPARRRLEEEQKARDEERRLREPASKAARKIADYWSGEVSGAKLKSANLSVEEGEELLALVEERRDGKLSDRKRKRYETLVGVLAGEPDLLQRRREEAEAKERQAAEAERARLDSMPLRRFEAKGGVFLPPFLAKWLWSAGDGSFDLIDVGVLATLLFAFEHGRTPFLKSEVVDGEIILDAAMGFQLARPFDFQGDVGAGRVRDSVHYLAGNGWFELDKVEGRTRIRLGERARKLLEEATAAVP